MSITYEWDLWSYRLTDYGKSCNLNTFSSARVEALWAQ